jgi:hypothetical protein
MNSMFVLIPSHAPLLSGFGTSPVFKTISEANPRYVILLLYE